MARIYKHVCEPDCHEKLDYIECDNNCGAKIKPNPDIMNSGWIKTGDYPNTYTCDYCPDCGIPDYD